jgi:hypothetical protein
MPFLAKYGFSLVYNRGDWHGRFSGFHINFLGEDGKKSENLRFEISNLRIPNLRIPDLRISDLRISDLRISDLRKEAAQGKVPRPRSKVKGQECKARGPRSKVRAHRGEKG